MDELRCPNFGVMKPDVGVKQIQTYKPVWIKKPDVGPLNMRLAAWLYSW